MKPDRLRAVERIKKEVNATIKTGSVTTQMITMVISGNDRNDSHAVHQQIMTAARKEKLL